MLQDDGGHDGTGGHDDFEVGVDGKGGPAGIDEFDSGGRGARAVREDDTADLGIGQDYRVEFSDLVSIPLRMGSAHSLVRLSISWFHRYPRSAQDQTEDASH